MPTMPMLLLSLAPSTRPRENAALAAINVLRDEVDILVSWASGGTDHRLLWSVTLGDSITGMQERGRYFTPLAISRLSRGSACCYDPNGCRATGVSQSCRYLLSCWRPRYPPLTRIAIFRVNGRWMRAAAVFRAWTWRWNRRSRSCNRKPPSTARPTPVMRWMAARPDTGSATQRAAAR